MKQKLTMILAFLLIGIGLISAQSQRVTGSVTSRENGEPIIGATVLVEGTNIGVITDINGKFTLPNVPATAKTVLISFLGMEAVSVPVQSVITATLSSDASTTIGQVVVIGMTAMDKRMFTGAADKLIADDVKIDGLSEISRALEGRAAGVSVQNVSGTFGAAPKIRVRSNTSILGTSSPLWVIDGVIMEDAQEISADDLASGNAETLISSAIAGLNADDIESFHILKDGSATSIYGARAMAGVIVVTTKSGKAGVSRLNYTGEFTMRLVPSYSNFNIMNSQDQMSVYQELQQKGWLNHADLANYRESGVYGKMFHLIDTYNPATGLYMVENTIAGRNAYLHNAEMSNTNWFDKLFDYKVMQLHSVSMSSGNEKSNYYASISALVDPGWSKKSEVSRYTGNIKANYNIIKNLDLTLITNASYRKQEAPGTLAQDIDPVRGEVKRDFDINPYSYALNSSRALDPNEFYIRNYAAFNILDELEKNYIEVNVADVKFQAQLKWKPIRSLTFQAVGAVRYQNSSLEHNITDFSNQAEAYRAMPTATIRDLNPYMYSDPDIIYGVPITVLPQGGIYNRTDTRFLQYDFRADVTYNQSFDNDTHIVNAYGGIEVNHGERRKTWFRGWGLQYSEGEVPFYAYQVFKKGVEDNNDYFTMDNSVARRASMFATGTYSYRRKYNVTGTIRYEGSNKLGKTNKARWLPTWNVGVAWNAHEENFFETLTPALSSLTVKASYSLVGNSGPAYVTNSNAVIKSTSPWRPFASVQETGLYIQHAANRDLTYEKQNEFNIGLEAGFLDGRINLATDWFRRKGFDLIGDVSTDGVTGSFYRIGNMAKMKTSGLELTLNSVNIKTKDFTWSTDFIFAHTKNKITKLETTKMIIDMITSTNFSMVGKPTRSVFSLKFVGLDDDGVPLHINELGEVTRTDINFQSEESKYLKYEGTVDPTEMGSFGNNFRYKNWKLNIFITYSWGNVVRLDPAFKARYTDMYSMPKEFKNRWVLAGDENKTNIPVIASKLQNYQDNMLSNAYNAYNYSTERIAKGDFIRLKEISLSYDFPKAMISKWKLSALSLKIQATNPFLIYADKKLNGQDPEFFNSGGVAAPVPKQFTLTLRIGL